MSSTSESTRDARMLIGVSAFSWTRFNILLYLLAIILAIPVVVFLFSGNNGSPLLWAFVTPAILAGLGSAVCALGAVLRGRSESEAGYTTLPAASPNLDQLDFRDGTILRRAGEPLLTSRGFLAFVRGEPGMPRPGGGAGPTGFPPRTPARIIGSAASWIIVIAVCGVIVFSRGMHNPVGLTVSVAAIVGFVAAIFLLIWVVTRVTLIRRIRTISAQRPTALIFTSNASKDVKDGMIKLGAASELRSGRFPVVVDDAGIELWSNEATPSLRLSIPWVEVTAIEAGRSLVGSNPFKAADVHLERSAASVDLPLAIYGRQGMGSASTEWGNQVLDDMRRRRNAPR